MNETSKAVIKMVLANDDSIQEEKRYLDEVLFGRSKPRGDKASEKSLLMNMTKAAKYLGVSRVTFWRLVKKGIFSPVRLGDGSYCYRSQDLDDFVSVSASYDPVPRTK